MQNSVPVLQGNTLAGKTCLHTWKHIWNLLPIGLCILLWVQWKIKLWMLLLKQDQYKFYNNSDIFSSKLHYHDEVYIFTVKNMWVSSSLNSQQKFVSLFKRKGKDSKIFFPYKENILSKLYFYLYLFLPPPRFNQ